MKGKRAEKDNKLNFTAVDLFSFTHERVFCCCTCLYKKYLTNFSNKTLPPIHTRLQREARKNANEKWLKMEDSYIKYHSKGLCHMHDSGITFNVMYIHLSVANVYTQKKIFIFIEISSSFCLFFLLYNSPFYSASHHKATHVWKKRMMVIAQFFC
jgi:hypothetical protein